LQIRKVQSRKCRAAADFSQALLKISNFSLIMVLLFVHAVVK
jgi:hypothetical protein